MEHIITLPLVVDTEGICLSWVGRLDPAAQGDWDRAALGTTIRVQAGAFAGTFTTVIGVHELVVLYEQWLDIWQHFGQPIRHQWTVQEGTVTLTTVVSPAGQLHLTVDVRDDPMADTRFQFRLSPEYMALAHWLRTLYDVLTRVPPHAPRQWIALPPQVEP